jgi:hypothetical protein
MAEASISKPKPVGRGRPPAAWRGRMVSWDFALAVFALAAAAGVGAAQGGYYATSWGWTALLFFWAIALVLLVRTELELGWLELMFGGALILFGGWVWLSTVWSESVPQSFLEGERVLVYVGGAIVALLLAGRRSLSHLLGGLLTGITVLSAYGLATRLFPNRLGFFDPVAGYRLEAPIGYWNALGILAAIGTLLALGFAARGGSLTARALAASVLAILLPTLYFTYSRGAWLALAAGILAAIAYEQRRLQLVTAFGLAALPPAVSVAIASRIVALTHKTASVEAATREGWRFALVVLAAGLASAALTVVFARAEPRVAVPVAARRAYGALLVAVLAAGLVAAFVRYGSPPTIARKAYDSFVAKSQPGLASNLNQRLFSLSGNGRGELWRVAWGDFKAHPLLGSGAGTYEEHWYRQRNIDLAVRDAHNLYLEQLAEVGAVGLGLLLLALVLPFAVLRRVRGVRHAGIAFAAYLAFLVHQGIDWDWELPVLVLTGLLCGVGLLASARGEPAGRSLAPPARFGGVAVAAALGALAFVGLVGNLALSASADAASHHDWKRAAARARRASDWAPWSSDALDQLGEAQLAQGERAAGVASIRRAIAKDPRHWQLWFDLYNATAGSQAQAAFRRTSQLDPYGAGG